MKTTVIVKKSNSMCDMVKQLYNTGIAYNKRFVYRLYIHYEAVRHNEILCEKISTMLINHVILENTDRKIIVI